VPWEYTVLQLCRDVYHCRPSELLEEDAAIVRVHLALLSTEARIRRFEQGGKGGGLGGLRAKFERHKRGLKDAEPQQS
jgi:hypothetical protein